MQKPFGGYYFCAVNESSHKHQVNNRFKKRIMSTENNESKKKSLWDTILKVIIAVASALAGVLGASAMSL